jgi:acyl-ACP thioesterase
VASDDVADAGWRSDEDLWLVRRTEIRVLEPIRFDEQVDLTTWASGAGVSAAARRTTLAGDRGGLMESESIWVHLDSSRRPARLPERFQATYGAAAAGRWITPRLELPDPPTAAPTRTWPLRFSDADVMGHANNAAYWQAIEEVLIGAGLPVDEPLTAVIEFRRPIEPPAEVLLRFAARDGAVRLGFAVVGDVRAAAAVWLSDPG